MKKKNVLSLALSAALSLSLAACGGNGGSSSPVSSSPASGSGGESIVVKVGVVGANNQQWDTVNELLAKENIKVELVEFAEYKLPNNALDAGEIDLNAFQHKAYLQKEIDDLGYDVAVLGDTIVAPLSLYSNKITDVNSAVFRQQCQISFSPRLRPIRPSTTRIYSTATPAPSVGVTAPLKMETSTISGAIIAVRHPLDLERNTRRLKGFFTP